MRAGRGGRGEGEVEGVEVIDGADVGCHAGGGGVVAVCGMIGAGNGRCRN